ncbi:hypothetical protein Vafri_2180 [Volvox africanus]|nr:hypothetical protein Vafri_2180 [Volvox africanus]
MPNLVTGFVLMWSTSAASFSPRPDSQCPRRLGAATWCDNAAAGLALYDQRSFTVLRSTATPYKGVGRGLPRRGGGQWSEEVPSWQGSSRWDSLMASMAVVG